jgi:hypothetical protein
VTVRTKETAGRLPSGEDGQRQASEEMGDENLVRLPELWRGHHGAATRALAGD